MKIQYKKSSETLKTGFVFILQNIPSYFFPFNLGINYMILFPWNKYCSSAHYIDDNTLHSNQTSLLSAVIALLFPPFLFSLNFYHVGEAQEHKEEKGTCRGTVSGDSNVEKFKCERPRTWSRDIKSHIHLTDALQMSANTKAYRFSQSAVSCTSYTAFFLA